MASYVRANRVCLGIVVHAEAQTTNRCSRCPLATPRPPTQCAGSIISTITNRQPLSHSPERGLGHFDNNQRATTQIPGTSRVRINFRNMIVSTSSVYQRIPHTQPAIYIATLSIGKMQVQRISVTLEGTGTSRISAQALALTLTPMT